MRRKKEIKKITKRNILITKPQLSKAKYNHKDGHNKYEPSLQMLNMIVIYLFY